MSKLICVCNQVTDQAIKNLVKKSLAISPEEIVRQTGASSGCGRCRTELFAFLRKLRATDPSFHENGQLLLPFPSTFADSEQQNDKLS